MLNQVQNFKSVRQKIGKKFMFIVGPGVGPTNQLEDKNVKNESVMENSNPVLILDLGRDTGGALGRKLNFSFEL